MTPEELADLLAVLAPEYVTDPRLAAVLTMVLLTVRLDHCYYRQVVALLVAHTLTLADRGGVAGQVSSEKEGDLERSYAYARETGLGSTSYGSEVMRLNRLCFGFSARTGWIRG